MTSALIRFSARRERGRKVVEVKLPRRILTALRSMNPESVRFSFGVNEQFEIDASELHDALVETHKRKRQEAAVVEAREKRRREAAELAVRAQKKAEAAKAEKKKAKAAEAKKKLEKDQD